MNPRYPLVTYTFVFLRQGEISHGSEYVFIHFIRMLEEERSVWRQGSLWPNFLLSPFYTQRAIFIVCQDCIPTYHNQGLRALRQASLTKAF